MGVLARWRARRQQGRAEQIATAAREDDAEDAQAARDRLLNSAGPPSSVRDWYQDDGGNWRRMASRR